MYEAERRLSFAALELSRGTVPSPHLHPSLALSSSQPSEAAKLLGIWDERSLLIQEVAVLRKCPVP